MSDLPTVSVREWTDLVRRARLGKTVKTVAFTLATFADYADGTRAYPGLARLAVAAEVSYKTARNAVAFLLGVGLIEVVKTRPGVLRRGTEYRLIFGEQLLERLDVLSPGAFEVAVDRVREGNLRSRRTGHQEPRPPDPDGPKDGVRTTPSPVDNQPGDRVPGTPSPVDNSGRDGAPATPSPTETGPEGRGNPRPVPGEGRGVSRPRDGVTGAAIPSIDRDTRPTSQPVADVRTAVTVPGPAGAAEDPLPDSRNDHEPLPDRCPHGLRARTRPDGTSTCALCRVAHRTPHPPPDNVIHLHPRTA